MRVGVLYGVTLAVVVTGAVLAWQERTNALEKHEDWVATKATHEIDLMGARSFLKGPQALSGNRLNLHAWHGFQEVWRMVDAPGVDGLAFDVYLGPEAYLCFWWGVPEGPRRAVLLSNRPGRGGGFMLMDDEGRFIARDMRAELDDLGRGWHGVALDLVKGRLTVGDQGISLPETHLVDMAALGFRGGREVVSIDGIRLTADGQQVYFENFFNDRGLGLPLVLSLLGGGGCF